MLKGIGVASKAVGELIGHIPLIKDGQVDEFLQDSGNNMKSNAQKIGNNVLAEFAELSNPETRILVERMEDMVQIYNHTDKICFDDKKIYLIAG